MKKKNINKKQNELKRSPSVNVPWRYILMGLTILLLFLLFDPRMSMGGDNCHYMSLARSILRGQYRAEAFIGAPPEVGAPPGYAFIMAISLAIFGQTFLPIKIFSFICFFFALLIWWKLFDQQGIDKRLRIVLLAFCILNPLIAEFSYWELTEAPFMLISSATILFFFITLQKGDVWRWIILGALATATFYIRIAGIVLLIAIGLTLLFHRKWKEFLIYSGVIFLLMLPWSIYYLTTGRQMGGGTYFQQFVSDQTTGQMLTIGGFVSKVMKNLSGHLFVNLPTMFFPIGQSNFANKSGLGIVIGLIFTIFIIIGIIKNVRSKQNLYSIYVILTMLMLISFSAMAVIVRYLVVIYPFIVILLIIGLEKIFVKIRQKQSYIFGLFLIITLLLIPSYRDAAIKSSRVRGQYINGNKYAEFEPNLLNFIEANEWLKKHDTTTIGVISRKPTLTWWFSGHPAQGYIWKSDVNVVKAHIDSIGAKYVIVDQISSTTPQFLIPTIRAFPDNFKVLYVTKRPETYVLEIVKTDSANILNQ